MAAFCSQCAVALVKCAGEFPIVAIESEKNHYGDQQYEYCDSCNRNYHIHAFSFGILFFKLEFVITVAHFV